MFQYANIHTSSEKKFVQQGTELLERAIAEAIARHGHCILGLSGGSTPGSVYDALGRSRRIDWSEVALFLADERYVPRDHRESNQRLVARTLLTHASIPRSNLIFPKTTLLLENCIGDYEDRLRALLAEKVPDIVVLGMGEDGHIVSLFPGDRATLEDRSHLVLPTRTIPPGIHFQYTPVPELRSVQGTASILKTAHVSERITVTLPLLMSACSMVFLLRGKGKQKVFEEMLSAPFDPLRYPAHALLQSGRTTWITCW